MNSGYETNLRDRTVCRVCNWLINHVATREYRAFVGLVNIWGQDEMDRWVAAGAPTGAQSDQAKGDS